MGKGRKAQPSAEKPSTVYSTIKDDSKVLHTPAGSAIGEEMKKDLFKLINVVKVT
jgi:hypothetical protein